MVYRLFSYHDWFHEPWPTQNDDKLRAIRVVLTFPAAERLIETIALKDVNPTDLVGPQFHQLIDALASLNAHAAQLAVVSLQAQVDKEKAFRARLAEHGIVLPPREEPPKNPDVVLVPLRLEFPPPDRLHPRHGSIRGWMPVGPGLDVAWDDGRLYRMQSPGKLELLYEPGPSASLKLAEPCYDGQYVWAPFIGQYPLVAVINPSTRVTTVFTEADGLPPADERAVVAATRPGTACVAASFGPWPAPRAWIGVLEANGDGGKHFRLIHEARQVHDDRLRGVDQFLDLRTAFYPMFAVTLPNPRDSGDKRVLIGTSSPSRPLVINPADWSVKVIDSPLRLLGQMQDVCVQEGAMYWLSPEFNEGVALHRLGYPDFKVEDLPAHVPVPWVGQPIMYQGRVHVVGYRWAQADSFDGPFQLLTSEKLPGNEMTRRVCLSAHYGLVLINTETGSVYQPEFHSTAPSGAPRAPGAAGAAEPSDATHEHVPE